MSDRTADVLVIGAGIAGASVAAELRQRCSVILLEAEKTAGVHSTGRSAASYLPSYGGPIVRALTRASKPLFDQFTAELGFELLTPRPLLWLANDEPSEARLGELLSDNPPLERLEPLDAVGLLAALRADRLTAAAFDPFAMDLDVAALHQAYLSRLKRSGTPMLYGARCDEIRAVGDGWRVTTGETTISVGAVVDAAGAWADEVAALAHVPTAGLQPKLRTVFLSSPRDAPDMTRWPGVVDACERWYFKPEHDLVLASPADETDTEPCDARPDELSIARAIDDINEATTLGLRSVSHSWAGLRTFARNREPVVGAWPGHPTFHFVAGQGGYGIQMAPALAKLAADVVVNEWARDWASVYGVTPADVAPRA